MVALAMWLDLANVMVVDMMPIVLWNVIGGGFALLCFIATKDNKLPKPSSLYTHTSPLPTITTTKSPTLHNVRGGRLNILNETKWPRSPQNYVLLTIATKQILPVAKARWLEEQKKRQESYFMNIFYHVYGIIYMVSHSKLLVSEKIVQSKYNCRRCHWRMSLTDRT